MDCAKIITSEDTYEFIVAADEAVRPAQEPDCIQKVSDKYEIWYYDKNKLPPLSVARYTYTAIPKCYGVLDSTNLEVSGILKLQNQPTLSLKGQGVFVAIIDTGINYVDDAFRGKDKKTRIFSMWDQTEEPNENDPNRQPPEGFSYGVSYSREQIDLALMSDDPLSIVPEYDPDGHGTFLASVACGSEDLAADFVGAAPEAELLVVKLKSAKKLLKDFYFIPKDALAYAESDLMAAISYVNRIALQENRPLVILMEFGTNNGNHAGSGPLAELLNAAGTQIHRAVVTASGNEANNRHHFYGRTESLLVPQKVEINVMAHMDGFYLEMWALAPELFAVAVQSPTGEIQPKSVPVNERSQNYSFLFEGTNLEIDYREAGRERRDQLIWLRFSDVPGGIWTILVYPRNVINGYFHMWLPMKGLLPKDVHFLRPTPEVTLTPPSDAAIPITVGGYNGANGALYLESGRGYDANGVIKPDFLAPAVDVQGKGLRNEYVINTGTSVAAAVTAGACAQILEWAVVRENALGINSVDIRNLLIRGATRDEGETYPSPSTGYGRLDAYRAFEILR
jgi:subtilisin family serine protease